MSSLRRQCTGFAPVHFYLKAAAAAAGIVLAAAPLSAAEAAPAAVPAKAAPVRFGQSVDDFYRLRQGAPLWLSTKAGDAASQLIALLNSASLDGLDPEKYHTASLQQALDHARGGKPKDVASADRMLSDAFVAFVQNHDHIGNRRMAEVPRAKAALIQQTI